MFIDTHTHLFTDVFDEDRELVVKRAISSGVEKMLLPNIDIESISGMNQLVAEFPNHCYPMMGLHPGYIKEDWENQLSTIEKKLFKNPEIYCAIGEIGMDLFWDQTFLEEQKVAFRRQVQWAKELNLPIAIHARNAFDEIFEILDDENNENLTF
jgi:TatD DNase family protein